MAVPNQHLSSALIGSRDLSILHNCSTAPVTSRDVVVSNQHITSFSQMTSRDFVAHAHSPIKLGDSRLLTVVVGCTHPFAFKCSSYDNLPSKEFWKSRSSSSLQLKEKDNRAAQSCPNAWMQLKKHESCSTKPNSNAWMQAKQQDVRKMEVHAGSICCSTTEDVRATLPLIDDPSALWRLEGESLLAFPHILNNIDPKSIKFTFDVDLFDDDRDSALFSDPLPETVKSEASEELSQISTGIREKSTENKTVNSEVDDKINHSRKFATKDQVVIKSKISARQRRLNSRKDKMQLDHSDSDSLKSVSSINIGYLNSRFEDLRKEIYTDGLSSFIKEVGRSRLLTQEEEIILSSKFQAFLKVDEIKKKLTQDLSQEPSLIVWAEQANMKCSDLSKLVRDAAAAKEKLVKSNLRLVLSVAKKYNRCGVDMADLISAGVGGLIRGIEKFDPCRGYKLSTYVHWWIRQSVNRAISDSGTIRLPVHIHETMSRIRRAKQALQEQGKPSTVDNLSEYLCLPKRKIINALQSQVSLASFDETKRQLKDKSQDIDYHQFISDDSQADQPWVQVDNELLKKHLNTLIESELNPKQREVVKLHYGLGRSDGLVMTRESIGLTRLGVSRERVRQVEMVAIRKLQIACIRQKLDMYC